MPEEATVQVDQVSHRYGTLEALSQVSFQVSAGQVVAVLGPNGSGKSTLFGILTTLLRPTLGSARIAGYDVLKERRDVRRVIGVVFQHPSLDEHLTVAENMMHQGHLYGLSGRALREAVTKAVIRYEVHDRLDHRVSTLSGGLKRRVDLSKTMLHHPRVLLLDEPSTGLDPLSRRSFFDHVLGASREAGTSVLLTTHLLDEADRADQVAFLNQGRLVAWDAPDALKRSIRGDLVTVRGPDPATLFGRVAQRFTDRTTLRDDQVVVESPHGAAESVEILKNFPDAVTSITVSRPTLDDVFQRLTGRRISPEPDFDARAN